VDKEDGSNLNGLLDALDQAPPEGDTKATESVSKKASDEHIDIDNLDLSDIDIDGLDFDDIDLESPEMVDFDSNESHQEEETFTNENIVPEEIPMDVPPEDVSISDISVPDSSVTTELDAENDDLLAASAIENTEETGETGGDLPDMSELSDIAENLASSVEEPASDGSGEIGEISGEIGSEDLSSLVGMDAENLADLAGGIETAEEIGADEIGAGEIDTAPPKAESAPVMKEISADTSEGISSLLDLMGGPDAVPADDIGEIPDIYNTDTDTPEISKRAAAMQDVDLSGLLGDDKKDNSVKATGKGSKKKKTEESGAEPRKKGVASFFHKLFDNIPYTDAELAAIPTPEQEAQTKEEKKKAAAEAKEAKKAAAEQKKAEQAEAKKAKQEAAKAAKAEKLKAKQEAKEARLQAQAAEEAAEGPEGHINKSGAAIVFVFFVLIAGGVVVGSSVFNYSGSIKAAKADFTNKEYNKAFDDISGITVKEKDMILHDKIYTVMYVNKQLNSFNNFYAAGDFASALDALIKGLKRYDKYYALADELGVTSDLAYVRKQILGKLSEVFGLSDQDAKEIMEITGRTEYSERIYEYVATLNLKRPDADKEPTEFLE
jgi:uncharacterized protein YaiL (DUF2058 family)